jgi:hypothetical protein
MSQREQMTNEALRALDEAHRRGRIQRDEYRSRRRELFESLRHANCTDRDTVRRAVSADAAPMKGAAAPHHGAGSAEETRRKTRVGRVGCLPWLAAFAALLAVAGLCVALARWLVSPSL